jgi:hypothetical protein
MSIRLIVKHSAIPFRKLSAESGCPLRTRIFISATARTGGFQAVGGRRLMLKLSTVRQLSYGVGFR